MKRNIIKTIGLFCIAGMVMGCTGDYDKINTDPTGLTDGDPGYILPYMMEQGSRMGSWEYQVGDNLHTNLYAQYFANSAAYFNSDNYTFRSDWVTDGFWNSYYVGVLKQFKNVKEIVVEKPQYDNIYQVMRIFTARCTAQTTDMFGDIPYTEAATGTSNAKYDSQQSIYTDLFKELTEAVTALNAHKDDAAQAKLATTQDLVYQATSPSGFVWPTRCASATPCGWPTSTPPRPRRRPKRLSRPPADCSPAMPTTRGSTSRAPVPTASRSSKSPDGVSSR